MPELLRFRPLLAIDGQTRADISEDIISASFGDGLNRLKIIPGNWYAGAYKYSESGTDI